MSTLIHGDFLHGADEYARAESFWKRRWEELVKKVGQGNWQTPWFNTTFVNGTPFRDGNPIFSAVCPNRRLGVNVVQLDPADEDLEFRAHTGTFGDNEDAIRMLVVTVTLTDRSAERALAAIERWITEERLEVD